MSSIPSRFGRLWITAGLVLAIGALILGGVPDADASEVTFSASVVKDTFLTYESIEVAFSAYNGSSTPFPRRSLIIGTAEVWPQTWNIETGERVNTCTQSGDYMPSRDRSALLTIPPKSSYEGSADLALVATCHFDSKLRLFHWLPGHYMVVFRWTCDPHGLPVIDGSPYLYDTVTFAVVEPTGADIEARDAFFEARRLFVEGRSTESLSALWNMARRHAESPYAGQALRYLVFHISERRQPPEGVTIRAVYEEFVRVVPERLLCRRIVRSLAALMDPAEYTEFLIRVKDAAPGTAAAKTAESLLEQPDR